MFASSGEMGLIFYLPPPHHLEVAVPPGYGHDFAAIITVQAGGAVFVPMKNNSAGPGPAAADHATSDPSISGFGANAESARSDALSHLSPEMRGLVDSGSMEIVMESYSGGKYEARLALRPAPTASGPSGNTRAGVVPDSGVKPSHPLPSWIFVIAAERDGSGRMVWSRGSEWSKSWLAPVRRDGTSLVSTLGDADDHDRVRGPSLPSQDAVRWLARKYRAPAVALLIRDATGEVTIDYWDIGHESHLQTSIDPSGDAIRPIVMGQLIDLARGRAQGDGRDHDQEAGSPARSSAGNGDDASGLEIDLERHEEFDSHDGNGFEVVLFSTDKKKTDDLMSRLKSIPEFKIIAPDVDDNGFEVAGTFPGDMEGFRATLARHGIPAPER